MADSENWWERDKIITKPSEVPTTSLPGTVINKDSDNWWENSPIVLTKEEKKKKRFVPSIGGEDLTPFGKVSMGPIDVEYPRSIKSAIGAAFGGPVPRGMPFIKDIIPTTAKDVEHMEKFPKTEAGMNMAGRVVAGIPQAMVMPFGTGLVGTSGNAAVQALLNSVMGTGERAVHNKEGPKLDKDTAWDAAFGAAGPVVGKVISPYQKPSTVVPFKPGSVGQGAHSLDYTNMYNKAKRMPGGPSATDYRVLSRKHIDEVNKINRAREATGAKIDASHAGVDRVLNAATSNPMARWGLPIAAGAAAHSALGHMGVDALAVAAAHWGPGALKVYLGNQATNPTTQAILNSMISGQREGQ